MVVDRRAPIASAFYRPGPEEPMGVRRRRRHGFDRDGEITAYEDEALDAAWTTDTRGGTLLADELERPRSGPMHDIVATIQPEQDELVRAPLEHTLCVQGAPGTGKTAVGLHRLAYLLYTERDDLWSLLRSPAEDLVVQQNGRRRRVAGDELAEILDDLRGGTVSYGAGRELLPHHIASAVLCRMEAGGKICEGRTHAQVRRCREVRAAVAAMWPKADPVRLVLGLLTDPRRLARAADGLLDAEEQSAVLLPGRPRGPKSARWSVADLALIDEAAHLVERRRGLAHVVVDEAQNLSPMQCRAVARRAGGSCTVLGDLAQATSPAAVGDWPALLAHLGRPGGRIVELGRGYRVPAQIIDYAARLLPRIAPGVRVPTSARRSTGALRVTEGAPGRLADSTVPACREALAGEGSVGLIAADADLPALHRAVTDAGLRSAVLVSRSGTPYRRVADRALGGR
ncbi:HelD family protein [Actinoallomurus sp. NBC_01490]|uniref:HelD family protein n=1 Tax=Actinoallomurus sp. NBC_01490 TaxID=2903557 RepID=UPI003FA463D6